MVNFRKKKPSQKPQSRSMAFSPVAFAGMLKAAEEFLGPERKWQFPELGEAFRPIYEQVYPDLDHPKVMDYIAMKAALGTTKPINDFMKERGFDIRLKDKLGPQDIAAACVFELKAYWEEQGEEVYISMKQTGKGVPGVSLEAVDFFSGKRL
jgi:hypothetical protein